MFTTKNEADTRRRKFRKISVMMLAAILILSFSACKGADNTQNSKGEDGGEFSAEAEKPIMLNIMCVGDIMAHSTNIKSATVAGGYDFNNNYDYVRDYIKAADLAMCNVETTFSGGTPSGYPLFNAPDELAQAIVNAGFDVGLTSNNHMMDTGFDGMQRTIRVLRDQGLDTAGSHLEGEEQRYTIVPVNGVNIGIIAYTYETSSAGGNAVSINGNPVSAQAQPFINSFNPNQLDTEDYARIGEDINAARNDGAEIIVCYMHWGEEYQQSPGAYQLAMAQNLADMGADVIFASHPHVIQPIDILMSADGRNVPVFYSLGNYISNQRSETLSNVTSNSRYTEQDLMGRVEIEYMQSTGEILSQTVSAVPAWVDRYGSPHKYAIVPLDDNISENPALLASGHLSRAKQALEDIKALIGDEYITGKTVVNGTGTSGQDANNYKEGDGSGEYEAA